MNPTNDVSARPDPLIDEIRAIRVALSERFDNDVRKLAGYLREVEAQHQDMFASAAAPVRAAAPEAATK